MRKLLNKVEVNKADAQKRAPRASLRHLVFFRARQCVTGACRLSRCSLRDAISSSTRQTRLARANFCGCRILLSPRLQICGAELARWFSRLAALHLKLRFESAREGQQNTEMPRVKRSTKRRPPQKAAQTCQGLFPHKGKAISVRERSRQSFAAIYLSRPTYAQARLPHAVDSAYQRRRSQ